MQNIHHLILYTQLSFIHCTQTTFNLMMGKYIVLFANKHKPH